MQSNFEEKVGDLIQKYRIKANDNNNSLKFIFNTKPMNLSLDLAEAGLFNKPIIICLGSEVYKY